jgi:PKD repeat protein
MVCLLLFGEVSAITFTKITPTPTVKLIFVPTTTATPAPGILHISTQASLDYLYIDDHLVSGSYGLHEYDMTLSPGTHSIYLMAPSFGTQWSDDWYPAVESSISQSALITSGHTTSVTLTPHPKGKLLFNSIKPDGGTLLIDNQDTLFQNQDGCFLVPGTHTVHYSKPGNVSMATTVSIIGLQKTPYSVSLPPVIPSFAPAALTIVTNKPSLIKGNKFSVTLTGTPSKHYSLYIKSIPMSPGTTYPVIDSSQVGVDTSDNFRAAMATTVVAGEIANYAGTVADVRTDDRGSRTVQFSTASTTGSGTTGKYYSIKVLNPDNIQNSATVDVRVDPGVDAGFTATPLSGLSPLTVQFTDTSTGSPDTWLWDFGDGTAAATSQNPVHTYTDPGTYSVNLTASKSPGWNIDSTVTAGYIQVTSPGNPAPGPVPNPAANAPSTGSLSVSSTPGSAAVILENKVIGPTPLTIPDIIPGTYSLKVVMTGYPDYSTMVTIGAGQVTTLDVDLASPAQPPVIQPPVTGSATGSPAPSGTGSLSVTTQPSGVKVYIDNVMGGVTPATIPGLAAGPHTIRLVMEGYEDLVTTVTITPGQTQEFSTGLSVETTVLGGVRIPGINKVPGFEAGIAFAGLCILLAIRKNPPDFLRIPANPLQGTALLPCNPGYWVPVPPCIRVPAGYYPGGYNGLYTRP